MSDTARVFSVHTQSPARQQASFPRPTAPVSSYDHQPGPSTSYRPNLLYIGTDALFPGSAGPVLDLGPLFSGQVSTETSLRQVFLGLLESAGVTAEDLLAEGYDDVMALPAMTLRQILIQRGLLPPDDEQRSSGQQSVCGPPPPLPDDFFPEDLP